MCSCSEGCEETVAEEVDGDVTAWLGPAALLWAALATRDRPPAELLVGPADVDDDEDDSGLH